MAQNLKVLNSKETKEIYSLLEKEFGYAGKLDVVFMLAEKKERIYIFTKDLVEFDLGRLRVDSMGLYFASLFRGQIRLTIEGSQMIGPSCTKNIIDVDKAEMQRWLHGEQLKLSELSTGADVEPSAFVLIRHGSDYLGCGKIGGDVILNYVPKTRYISATFDDYDVPDAPGEPLPQSDGGE